MLPRVDIPASDGFAPRPPYVYLPPAYATHLDRRLPVLELLHGAPGEPADWLTRGMLVATEVAFAATHRGAAPIGVVPDINGVQCADSHCIRTRKGDNIQQCVTSDVVSLVRARYSRAVGRARWWMAGLSEGGVCSLLLALRHPSLYSAFGDISDGVRPIVAQRTAPVPTRPVPELRN